jgi:hypothetical protein
MKMIVKVPKTIQFNLLSNAKDSLRQSVELIAMKEIGSDHARLKHAIIASHHCIELLLKERLRLINPESIWEIVDKRTVTINIAISKLKFIGNVKFSRTDEENLRSLRKMRNAIEHHEWETSEKEAKIILGHSLSFAIGFAQDELKIDLSSEFRSDDTWAMLLNELHDFAKVHGARIGARLRGKATCCDECGELTVPFEGRSCELCGHWHWQSIKE